MDETTTLTMVESLVGVASTEVLPRRSTRLSLRDATDRLRQSVGCVGTLDELLHELAILVQSQAAAGPLLHYQSDETRPLSRWLRPIGGGGKLPSQSVLTSLMPPCSDACARNESLVIDSIEGVAGPVVIVPVTMVGPAAEALCAIPVGAESLDRTVALLQLAAAQVTVWHSRRAAADADDEAQTWAAILELIEKLETSDDITIGCQSLVNHACSYLGSERVAVGLCKENSKLCRVEALSGIARFDKHAEMVTAIEAALDETVLKNDLIEWPSDDTSNRHVARAHEQLLGILSAQRILSAPLHDSSGNPAGAWLFVNPIDRRTDCFAQAARQPVGIALRWLHRSRGSLFSRARRKLLGRAPKKRGTIAISVCAVVALLLLWPRPHKIGCDCQLQPLVRQFISAPHEGTLADAHVKAGDVVSAGDVLATMDGREIRIELAGIEAEYGRAKKAWEASLSAGEIHEAQQSKLELQRLESERQLLRQREQNLQLKSPLRGVVVRGDLEKSRGAPLSLGQSLFEIAPLDRMNVEIVVPEEEISFVSPNMKVKIRLEAYPTRVFPAEITQIVPQAEVTEEQLVFLAEAEIENASELLRPGMNGRATLIGNRKTTAWLLLHKPYESLLLLLGV